MDFLAEFCPPRSPSPAIQWQDSDPVEVNVRPDDSPDIEDVENSAMQNKAA